MPSVALRPELLLLLLLPKVWEVGFVFTPPPPPRPEEALEDEVPVLLFEFELNILASDEDDAGTTFLALAEELEVAVEELLDEEDCKVSLEKRVL